jgi:hypothetical protein
MHEESLQSMICVGYQSKFNIISCYSRSGIIVFPPFAEILVVSSWVVFCRTDNVDKLFYDSTSSVVILRAKRWDLASFRLIVVHDALLGLVRFERGDESISI